MPGRRAGDSDEASSSGAEKFSDLGSIWETGLTKLAARTDEGVQERDNHNRSLKRLA